MYSLSGYAAIMMQQFYRCGLTVVFELVSWRYLRLLYANLD